MLAIDFKSSGQVDVFEPPAPEFFTPMDGLGAETVSLVKPHETVFVRGGGGSIQKVPWNVPGFGESDPIFGLGGDGMPGTGTVVTMWVVGTAFTLGIIALGVFLTIRAGRGVERISTKYIEKKYAGRRNVGDYEEDWDDEDAPEAWERMTERAAQHAPRCENYNKIATKLRSCKKSADCSTASERQLYLAVQHAFTGDCQSAEKFYRKSFA